MAEAQQGNREALGELFSRYWRAARAAAFGVTGNVPAAEDAAAEAFRQTLVSIYSLRDPDRFATWLRTIVIRKARVLHNRRQTESALAGAMPDPGRGPDEELAELQLRVVIQRAVSELPDRLREVVSLVYFEGYDPTTAARFLGIPDGTFRRRMHESRKRLRNAVEHILKKGAYVNEEQNRKIGKLRKLIDKPDDADDESFYQAIREALALRPAPKELIDLFHSTPQLEEASQEAIAARAEFGNQVQKLARRFTGPSARASDPSHPVGRVVVLVRQMLPDFRAWTPDVGAALASAATNSGSLKALRPPGFAEGRPGAFLHVTRAFVFQSTGVAEGTMYQLLKDSADSQMFRLGLQGARISDVLDLTWMITGPLELRSVQELLERLTADILPGTPVRFSSYDEPRYRSCLQLQIADMPAPAATGGVLAEWSGRPRGVDAAHLRIFIEPWATVTSGQLIEPQSMGVGLGMFEDKYYYVIKYANLYLCPLSLGRRAQNNNNNVSRSTSRAWRVPRDTLIAASL